METNSTTNNAYIFVRLERAPGALERVLQPFSVAGLVPARLLLRHSRKNSSFVAARFCDIDCDRAVYLADRLRAVPCAQAVRLKLSTITRDSVTPLAEN